MSEFRLCIWRQYSYDRKKGVNMKVFLSWHGEISKKVALTFQDWLPKVINLVRPFVSQDIGKGERWSDELAKVLNKSDYGIIFMTKNNLKAPWIHFEAGAISNVFGKGSVCPFLFRVERSEIKGPLEQFQFTLNEKNDIFKLLKNINNKLNRDQQLPLSLLSDEFKMWWPELKRELDEITDAHYEKAATGYEWLYTEEDLQIEQKKIECKEIWIITDNLFNRVLAPPVINLVMKNIELDVIYTFITPSDRNLDGRREEINKLFATKPDNFTIIPLDEKIYQSLSVTDYIILNPKSVETRLLHIFIELPLTGEHNYWIEADKEAAVNFVHRFNKVVKKNSP